MRARNIPYLKAFGENLYRIMESKGKTPLDVAVASNIELKQIYRVKNGEHSASISTIVSIAKGLDIHPRELFDFEFDFNNEG